MKTILCGILLFTFCLSYSQQSQNSGILWERDLNWDKIRAKAARENKYIFVDCFTTWCGPCKRMDEEVYVSDSVGKLMNMKFISVKIQMDQTKNDNNEVRNWYKDALELQKQYRITAYPSYLFFSPQGQIIHRDVGYKEVNEFISTVTKATDPKSQFYVLKAQYEKGNKNYDKVRYLMDLASKFRDHQFAERLNSDYLDFLFKQKKNSLFTQDNIDFVASAVRDTKSPWFKIFYSESKRINAVMQQSGFSNRAIDSAIAREYINPHLRKVEKGKEPDWHAMYSNIKRDFDETRALRNITWTKAMWYRLNKDKQKYWNHFIECVDVGAMDTSYYRTDVEFDFFEYEIAAVMKPDERSKALGKGIKMMEGVVRRADRIMKSYGDPRKDSVLTRQWVPQKIDNYASLLYLAGKKNEAIEWMEKCVQIAEFEKSSKLRAVKSDLSAMKNGTF